MPSQSDELLISEMAAKRAKQDAEKKKQELLADKAVCIHEKEKKEDQSKYYIQEKKDDKTGLYNINIYTDCNEVGNNVDKFIRYNVINSLYFYFQLYSNDVTKPKSNNDGTLKLYKQLLKCITNPKLSTSSTNNNKSSDDELKGLLELDKQINTKQRIELLSGFNSIYPIISPSIVFIMHYNRLISKDNKLVPKTVIEASLNAVSHFKLMGYYAPTVLIGFLLFLLQGNEQVNVLKHVNQLKRPHL